MFNPVFILLLAIKDYIFEKKDYKRYTFMALYSSCLKIVLVLLIKVITLYIRVFIIQVQVFYLEKRI